ncbi:bile acid:sodium symporter family protein [Corynebacterium sp. BF-R-2]|uniref:bile acid:sodium symporter family protein n=1 Tax=Corynebacterium sp. BF-R-2 TaxID=2943494 RepID=UPI00211E8856|nr:bile acid:sodium symporter family protein [Corynebacterium sp. BF-R-2]MCQ9677478.1 bile acid:sodium symporter family protein [Corynebacterium sp. BF-R-2]
MNSPRTEGEAGEKLAVYAFPLVIVACAAVAFMSPSTFEPVGQYTKQLLMVIMFSMGLTLTFPDLALVAKRPLPIFLGVLCQFAIMPTSALLVAKILGLSDAATVGLILLGSVPGGTASNVMAYLAKGDVALSVAMTSVSTLVSPIMTPLLMLWLAGETADVDGAGMMWSLVQTVLIPVGLGLLLRVIASTVVDKILPVLPWVAIAGIGAVVMAVVSQSQDKLVTVGLIVFVGVAIQNAIGFLCGYYLAKLARERESAARTTAIEVATQNSGLASALALQFFTPEAALPGVVAAVWANVTGAIFSAIVRRTPLDEAPMDEELATQKAG